MINSLQSLISSKFVTSNLDKEKFLSVQNCEWKVQKKNFRIPLQIFEIVPEWIERALQIVIAEDIGIAEVCC